MKWLPPKEWWFGMQPGREGDWWRTHVVAHVGHGAIFYVVWWLIGVGNPILAALFFAVLWEAWQRETWPAMPLVENVWDVILSAAGIGVVVGILALMGCASPTEPTCYQTAMPMVDVAGDTASTVTTNWCVHTTYMP